MLIRFLRPVGVVNMSFPLSDQPVLGDWFVFVEVQGHTYNKSFEVQKYGEDLHTVAHLPLFIESTVMSVCVYVFFNIVGCFKCLSFYFTLC